MRGAVSFDVLPDAFLRAFYMKWLAEVVQARPPLARFDALTHEQRIAEFRRLDREVLAENQAALVGRLRDRAQERLQDSKAREALPFLQREMAKQRNHSPLRKTLRHAESAIRAIKPCFLMSPLSVAQYLAGGEPSVRPRDLRRGVAAPVGGRGRRDRARAAARRRRRPEAASADELLHGRGVARCDSDRGRRDAAVQRCRERARGVHGRRRANESAALALPQRAREPDQLLERRVLRRRPVHVPEHRNEHVVEAGLRFEFVEGGTYEGKGLNSIEARRVADEVVAFAREQLARRARGEPTESLGVGTFNLRQQLAVQDELELRRRDDPTIEPFFDRSLPEPFFVKNLENIQGDERDVDLPERHVREGRGRRAALQLRRAERRERVAAPQRADHARAPSHARVLVDARERHQSMRARRRAGPRLLRDFLDYAEHGRLAVPAGASAGGARVAVRARGDDRRSPSAGCTVVPQVGVAGYRIDLGVVDRGRARAIRVRHRVRRRRVPLVGDGARSRPAAAAGARGARVDAAPRLVHRLVQGSRRPGRPDRAAGRGRARERARDEVARRRRTAGDGAAEPRGRRVDRASAGSRDA